MKHESREYRYVMRSYDVSRIRIVLNSLLIGFAAIFTLIVFLSFTNIPRAVFVDLPKIHVLAKSLENERRRKSLGMEPRHWKTPTKMLFQNESLQQLCHAVARMDYVTFDKLVSSNLDLNEVGEDGLTVLFFAYLEGDYPSFIKLLEKGAKPDFPLTRAIDVFSFYPIPRKGDTVFLAACSSHERFRFFLPSLEHTSDPNQQNAAGMTALHLLIFGLPFGGDKRLKGLLDAGADPRVRDNFGKTPIDYAATRAPELLPYLEQSKQL